MVRTLFFWFCVVGTTLVLGLLALITYPFDSKGKRVHGYARLWGRVALWANGVKVRVEGLENVQKEGPYIFMSNHQGAFDIFALLGHLPFQFKWLAKKELFSIPFFGWTMAAAGYISIDRKGTRETVKAMNEAAQKIQNGMSVVIFPEGTRSPDGSIQPFKKGGFTLAIKSEVPVVPVAIRGSREIMPKETFILRSGRIRIRIAPSIPTKDLAVGDWRSVMDRVRESISENFQSISVT